MSNRGLSAIFCAVILLGVAAPAPSLAVTGSYEVTFACTTAPGSISPAWPPTDNDVANISQGIVCPPQPGGSALQQQEQGLYTVDNLTASGGAITGARAGDTFTAPANTTITELSWDRYFGIHFEASWSVGLQIDGVLQPSDTCTADFGNSFECSVGGAYGQLSSHEELRELDAHQMFVGVECTGGGCTSGATIHRVWASVYDATVTLSDSTPPAIGPFTGSLASGGAQSGTQSVSFPVSDSTGVEELDVRLDGQILPGSPGVQPCDYTEPKPCPSRAMQIYAVNTVTLTDGPHTVEVKAIDAAGLVSTANLPFTVSNHPTLVTPGPLGNSPLSPGPGSQGAQTTPTEPPQSKLRITRAQVIGSCLILTAKLPPDFGGLMTFTIAARHSRHTIRTKRTVKIIHGVGHVALKLNALARSASRLALTVRYDGDRTHRAQTSTTTVRVPHARVHRIPSLP
jgi:hypothetical protein